MSPERDRLDITQADFFQHADRGNVLGHNEANNLLETKMGEAETDGGERGFSGKALAPISRQQAVGDVDLAQLFQILQAGEADLLAGAFQDAGATAEAMFPVVSDGMIDQKLAGLFDVEQWFVGDIAYYLGMAVQREEGFCILFHEFPEQEPLSLENHFHVGQGQTES